MKRVIIVHQWGGGPTSDFYPLLKENHLVLFGDIAELTSAGGTLICKMMKHCRSSTYLNIIEYEAYALER